MKTVYNNNRKLIKAYILSILAFLLFCLPYLLFANEDLQKKDKKSKIGKYSPKQEKSKKTGQQKNDNGEWNFQFSSTALYDDNILAYSDKYREKFKNNEDLGRFHIDTYDDLYFSNSLSAEYKRKFFGELVSALSMQASYKNYINNPVKDRAYLNFGIKQELTDNAEIKLGYSVLPDFYVRHYIDADYADIYGYTENSFKPFSFAKDNFYGWLQYSLFKGTALRFSYSYIRYFHNEYFTEYDSRNSLFGFMIEHELFKNFKLNLAYNFQVSEAQAYDEQGENSANSDDADASYDSEEFSLGASWVLPELFGMRNNISADFLYERAFFRTNHTADIDPLHSGRKDYYYGFSFKYAVFPLKYLSVGAICELNFREAGSSSEINSVYISDEKSYNKFAAGIEIAYYLKIK